MTNPPLATAPAEEPAVTPAEEPATPATPAPAEEETPEETSADPAEETEPAAAPAEPSAPESIPSATIAPKLSAFERGKLRMLGMGDLIARVEVAEANTFTARAQLARIEAENKDLRTQLAAVPTRIEAAAKAEENALAKAVTAELSTIGISAEAAPSQIPAADAEKIITRAEFDKLDHPARNAFMRNGGKITA